MEIKKKYCELEKKYKLPSYLLLSQEFEIEKIDTETDFPLRAVRKVMMDKVLGFLSFLERLSTNPTGLPRIYYPYIKSMTNDDKNEIEKIYFALGELSLLSFELEIDSTEKEEADMIKHILALWQAQKASMKKLAKQIHKPQEKEIRKDKNYFG